MYRYGPLGFHHGPGPLAWVLLALFLAAIVLAVIAVVRLWRHPGAFGSPVVHAGPPPVHPVDPALSELRVRYARGDLTWEEYAQRATNLGFPVAPPAPPVPPPSAPAA
ncbi:MAG TPA: hypothetical protein VMV22_00340 [Acidimicrobiales bacterium]|nr:hypothetical protein [Acidimicrobiales bacterium]